MTTRYGHMTSNHGLNELEPFRECHADARALDPFTAWRELPARARTPARRPPVGRAEGIAEPRARRDRRGAARGANPGVPAGSPVFRPRSSETVPAPSHGA